MMIDRHLEAKKKHSFDVQEVYNLSPFLISYVAALQPTLGHCPRGSLTDPMLITAFKTYLIRKSPCNEVGSQNLAKHPVRFEPRSFRFAMQCLNPLCHSL